MICNNLLSSNGSLCFFFLFSSLFFFAFLFDVFTQIAVEVRGELF